jgi:processive 1,2-diacylglycerol beta-glucosyltransferase
MTRVLILTASVGEGHDVPARTLAAQLASESPEAEILTEDGLEPMGRFVTAISADSGRIVFFHFRWLWDAGYWFFARARPTRLFTQTVLTLLGAKGLLRLIERIDPDVIVSTYPNTTEVLGRLREDGRVRVPVCSAITDLAAMHYWAGSGIDLHLVAYPQSIAEVRTVAGPSTRVVAVHGLTSAAFLDEGDREEARRCLELPLNGKIALVSGGGWGVGDIDGAIEAALTAREITCVICLCGRNVRLRQKLASRFGDDPRVRVEGFTERMADWMTAADVLVHSTGGLTVLEALMSGLPAISYGWGRGHVRLNNAAFERGGLAQVVTDRAALAPALARALAGGRPRTDTYRHLPSAASLVLDVADGRTKLTATD